LVSTTSAHLIEGLTGQQAEVAEFDQEKMDRICEAMRAAALREAARLGALPSKKLDMASLRQRRRIALAETRTVWHERNSFQSKDVVEIASQGV